MKTQPNALMEYRRILKEHLLQIDPQLTHYLMMCLPWTNISKQDIVINIPKQIYISTGLRQFIENRKVTAENLISNLTNAPKKIDVTIVYESSR